jgi:hypothetical protein
MLMAELFEMTGVHFSLQWWMISIRGRKIPKDQQIRAVHFESDVCYANINRQTLKHLYGTNCQTGFPLGVGMRLVPELSSLSNKHSRENLHRLRNCHAALLQNI